MNALYVVIFALILFGAGYKYYASRLVRLYGVDANRKTPAQTKYDGVDFVPARHWTVLFGHHFASISGAGPIIGPVLAVAFWGWGPALLWIVLGTIFIGGVHDFGSLMVSVKHGGCSIAEVAHSLISKRARLVFSAFVWLSLILVVAVFLFLCAETFTLEPRVVIPSLGLILVALIVGYLLYGLKWNQAVVTILGLALLTGLLFLGNRFPIKLGPNGHLIWSLVLLAYCYIASTIPVQILLQPRDYLSGFLLAIGVIFGYGGLLLTRPEINIPFFVVEKSAIGPLWPMLFVTVACGAISGFHCLVASGTSSKQLNNEKDAKKIGYGGMVVEGMVAVLALLAVAAGIANRDKLSGILAEGGPGPVGAFGLGFGEITRPLLAGFGGLFAITILNAFILTTLDTGTRICRYLTEELFKVKNRFLATIIVVVVAGWLALTGNWKLIWPVFGASNQLVAALALIVVTCWLLSKDKPVKFTLIPSIFMLVTTVGALGLQVNSFLRKGDFLLAAIAAILLALAGYMIFEVYRHYKIRTR